MKQIRIEKISIQNFKKIKSLEIEVDGSNLNLVGVNGSGKSTVFDAFTWCLFGKDSQNRSDSNKDFVIKPHTQDGQPIHNLETSVELVLSIDGRQVQLKRVYSEVWAKKRGSEERELTGHTTEYFVNGVPRKKSEYEEFIKNEIIDENTFKSLTNVSYFTSLSWKEQRELLEKLATKTDMQIIDENPSLEPLRNELIFDRTVEDVIKMYKDSQKKINEQLSVSLPAQLKALHDLKYPNLEEHYNDAETDRKLNECFNKLSDIESKLASGYDLSQVHEYENGIAQIEKDIVKIERDILSIEHEAKMKRNSEIQNEKGKLAELEFKLKQLENEKKSTEERIQNGKNYVKELEEKINKLYEEYDKVELETFTENTCSYCGQTLPSEKLEELMAHFNKHKSERLEKIVEIGKQTRAELEKCQSGLTKLESELLRIKSEIEKIALEIETQRTRIVEVENAPFEKLPEVIEKEKLLDSYRSRIELFKKEIQKIKEKGSNDVLLNAKLEIQREINYLNSKKAEYQLKFQNEEKIRKLEQEQRDLQNKFEDAQRLISLGEKFRMIKANTLESQVNDNFKLVKFQLFNELLNGAIEPTCVATYNGVLYPSCSTGEKINIGLDIINGLQKIYGVSAPIFIDNAEAVSTWLVDCNSQLIKMFVDEKEKVLKIEKEVK